MKTTDELYFKIQQLNQATKENLLKKGIVVPIQKGDGSIKIGNYLIKKITKSFYTIYDYNNRPILEGINLPQTAILIANKLALGKWVDADLLQLDKKYGYASFDELAHYRSYLLNSKQKKYDKSDIMNIKSITAQKKKDYYKKAILSNFQKLLEFR